MTVATEKQRIIDILKTDTDIKNVDRGTLREAATFPTFLVWAGPSTRSNLGNDQVVTERVYRIIGLVMPLEEERETEAEKLLETYYDKVEVLFETRPGLWLTDYSDTLDGVMEAELTGDSGYTSIILGGGVYAGSEWTLRVETHKKVTRGQ